MQTTLKMKSPPAKQLQPGDIRRFGPDGVLYEIKHKTADGLVLIRVLDTGEETLYPLAKALEDPQR